MFNIASEYRIKFSGCDKLAANLDSRNKYFVH